MRVVVASQGDVLSGKKSTCVVVIRDATDWNALSLKKIPFCYACAPSKKICGRYGRDEGNSFQSRVVIQVVKKRKENAVVE